VQDSAAISEPLNLAGSVPSLHAVIAGALPLCRWFSPYIALLFCPKCEADL